MVEMHPRVPDYAHGADKEIEEIFHRFRPGYQTPAGWVMAGLHNTGTSKNGWTVAFYDVNYRNPQTEKRESVRYLYGVRNKTPYEIKKLSHIYND